MTGKTKRTAARLVIALKQNRLALTFVALWVLANAAVFFFVFVDGARGGVAAGAVAVPGDVFGMGIAGHRWSGVFAAVGPVLFGAFDGVGVDGGLQIANGRWQIGRGGGDLDRINGMNRIGD